MAPMSVDWQESVSSYQALVNLERSTASVQDQLAAASSIIKLENENENFNGSNEDAHEREIRFWAREEWILRWILSKLSTNKGAGDIWRTEPRSWLLLRRVARRLPVRSAARLLISHNFCHRIEEALLAASTQSQASDGAETVHKLSKKRKRPSRGAEVASGAPSPSRHDERILLLSVASAVTCVIGLADAFEGPDEEDNLNREYMKSVLRVDVPTGARILGSAFTVANELLKRESGGEDIPQSLQSMVEIWHHRYVDVGDKAGRVSNDAFANFALTPAIALLNTCHRLLQNSPETRQIIEVLEGLIAIHIFLPARANFLDSVGTNASNVETKANKNAGDKLLQLPDLLSPVQSQTNDTAHSEGNPQTECALTGVIPTLFELSLRSLPAYGPRWRVSEAAWLQNVFNTLLATIGLPLGSTSKPALNDKHLATIKHMLQIALEYNVSIDTQTLREITLSFTGLVSDEGQKDVHWAIISQILKLDVNVFLAPEPVAAKEPEEPGANGSLVDILFSRITERGQDSEMGASANSKTIRTSIVLPLMEEFARGRDLNGYLERWRAQLFHFYRNSTNFGGEKRKKSRKIVSVWEHDDLTRQLKQLLEGSLTATQILRELQTFRSRVNIDLADLNNPDTIADVMSSVVVMEAVLSSVTQEETVDTLSASVITSYETFLQLLALDAHELTEMRWRLYRSITKIQLQWSLAFSASSPAVVEDASGHNSRLLKGAIKSAAKLIKKFASKDSISFKYLFKNLEALEAFRFLSTLPYILPSQNHHKPLAIEAFNSAAAQVTDFIERISGHAENEDNTLSCWLGETEKLTHASAVALGFTLPLVESPAFLLKLISEVRIKLLSILYKLARKEGMWSQEKSWNTNGLSFLRVWEALLNDDSLLNDPSMKAELSSIISSTSNKSIQGKGGNDRQENATFLAECYLKTPLSVLHRHQREEALNVIYENYLEARPMGVNKQRSLYMSSMVKLMRLPNPSSKIATIPDAPWKLAESIGGEVLAEDATLCLLIEELQKLNLEHLISTRDQPRSRQYLTATLERVNRQINQNQNLSNKVGIVTLITTTLSVFNAYRSELQSTTNTELLPVIQTWLQSLMLNLSTLVKTFAHSGIPDTLIVSRCIIQGIVALIDASEDAGIRTNVAILGKEALALAEARSQAGLTGNFSTEADYLALLIRLYEVIVRANGDDIAIHQSLGSHLLSKDLMEVEQDSILNSFRLSSRNLSVEKKLSLLDNLRRGALDGHSSSQLLLLKTLIDDIDDYNQGTGRLGNELLVTFFNISKDLNSTISYEHFSSSMDCLEIMARKRGFPMSQWNIDSLIGSLNAITSSTGPRLPAERAGPIFLKICHLLNTFMSLHRTKLGGRFHLLVTLMQNLLQCLLIPGGKPGSSMPSAGLPPWCVGGQSVASASMGTACAEGYARLLSTLCEPTVSQVTGSRTRAKHELNDEVRKAKATVAKYLPYLLMKYIECQLRTRVSAEQKAALSPGFHTAFGLLSPESLRALNAAMDSSSRAIFKSLYEDYRRFGRWQEE
ncbi:hypothetical protein L228DRAFT_267615 [Xylona heveae TC161]|uniref:Nucleolar 27S pre-rRNA processing Urb2/Npa2 C-terminal domain-containing protein n=1 Tax=Xylona heveae (strain CBS 132557 / TC161) TaxID=1328760 RepID=A0A165HK56_XYLHT|nr:hypothetical protein L228DRAFT_267615 [Xylona heveae TC161]KZF23635.1 hypothetical protein L228DRAFT_267615 [Xylona heveae TC161]